MQTAVMNFVPLSDNAARQVIDSTTVFTEHQRVKAAARPYAGTMYWKKEGNYEYLVKTQPRRRSQLRMAARSEETERIFSEYTSRKRALELRLASLHEALVEAERMNKALKVGRTPNLVVTLLQVLDDAGLSEHFTVVGTHALYAYETAASVRLMPGALATQDVDLLWDARRRVQFMTDLEQLDASMLGVLQRADRTFERKEGQNETAIKPRVLKSTSCVASLWMATRIPSAFRPTKATSGRFKPCAPPCSRRRRASSTRSSRQMGAWR